MAAFDDDVREDWTVMHKLEGQLFSARQDFSPYNVVACE